MKMTIAEKTVREIALESPASVRVFEEFNIDYCCGGAKSLSEACIAVDAAPEEVQERLNKVFKAAADQTKTDLPEQKSAPDLIEYILDNHHVFTKKELERLQPLMEKVAGKHGSRHPELVTLHGHFKTLYDDLLPHMQKEESILFPFIGSLSNASSTGMHAPPAPFGSVQNPIRMMMSEHDKDGAILKEMRALTNEYKAPADACPSYNALYFGLEELERDLHRHIHLENNVLFPMAMNMEQGLL